MRKGFTLIEMVIVVAVIAILAGLLVPMVGGLIEEARVSRMKSELKQIATATITYNAKKAYWPRSSATANRGYYMNAHGALNPYLCGAYGSYLNAQVGRDPWNVGYSYWVPNRAYGNAGYPCILMSCGTDRRNNGTWNANYFRYGIRRGDDELLLLGNPWGS